MSWIEKKKNSQVLKICIGKREYEDLISHDTNLNLVKHWIRLGRETYTSEDRNNDFLLHVDEVFANQFSAFKNEIENKMLVQSYEMADLKSRVDKLQTTLDQFIKMVIKK